MRTQEELLTHLEYRIQSDTQALGGTMPERFALAWGGYIAGLYEWKIIELKTYKKLLDLLPKVGEPDPILTIFTGRDDDDSSSISN
jgi:hypothetical protein